MEARKKERSMWQAEGKGGKGPEKEVNDEAAEEAKGGRCESSALTLGFDARP